MLFELFADFDDEAAAAVVHGADDYAVTGDQQDVAHIQSHARLRARNTLPVNYKESEIYA